MEQSIMAQVIPRSPLSNTRAKFNFNKCDDLISKEVERGDLRSPEMENKVLIEVKLTEEHFRELMKCKPTNEWVSKTGKTLKHAFPELTKAYREEDKERRVRSKPVRKKYYPNLYNLVIVDYSYRTPSI
jgi:hypothetical protein